MFLNSVALPGRKVLEQNLPHELELIVSGLPEHARRQVPLERGENLGAEIQLHVVVVIRIVVIVRVQPQPG